MDRKDLLSIIVNSYFFLGLSVEECTALTNILTFKEKNFQKGEIIFNEKEAIQSIGLIISGRVFGEKFYHDGQSHLVHSFEAGETIGLETIFSSRGETPNAYLAEGNVHLLMLSCPGTKYSTIIPPKTQIKIKDNVIRILANESIKSMYKLEVLSKRSLRSRIMTFLRIMEKKTGKKTFQIKMDRERFARYLCVNRSALSYELGEMKKDGLIYYKKDQFTIL